MSNPEGRPTKKTELVVKKLEEAFAMGCSITEACLYADISRETYYNWTDKDKELSDRFDLLRETPILDARKTIAKAVKDDPKYAAWYLERKKKEEFSTRHEVDDSREFKDIREKLKEFMDDTDDGGYPSLGGEGTEPSTAT